MTLIAYSDAKVGVDGPRGTSTSPKCAVRIRMVNRSVITQSVVTRSVCIRSFLGGGVVGSRNYKCVTSNYALAL